MSLDSLCRWQVQVSVYFAWRIPAYLRCTQCSILLHRMDICFLTCICLWQISQIQTRLFNVVGPGLVSTSPGFVSSSASYPSGPHGRHAHNTVIRAPIAGGGEVRHNLHRSLTLSCLVELLFLLCFIATWTCVVVSVMLVLCSLVDIIIFLLT